MGAPRTVPYSWCRPSIPAAFQLRAEPGKTYLPISTKYRYTNRNPTDRGKPGMKHQLVVDRQGILLAAELALANVHDTRVVEKLTDAIVPIRVRGAAPASDRPRSTRTSPRIYRAASRRCVAVVLHPHRPPGRRATQRGQRSSQLRLDMGSGIVRGHGAAPRPRTWSGGAVEGLFLTALRSCVGLPLMVGARHRRRKRWR